MQRVWKDSLSVMCRWILATPVALTCAGCTLTASLDGLSSGNADASAEGGARRSEQEAAVPPAAGGTGGYGAAGGAGVGDAGGSGTGDAETLERCADGTGEVCVLEAPSRWRGPALLWSAPSGEAPPSCPGSHPSAVLDGGEDFDPGDVSCPACSCDPPDDPACEATVSLFAEDDCSGDPVTAPVSGGDCDAVTHESALLAFDRDPPRRATATCVALTEGEPVVEPPGFGRAARLCEGPAFGDRCGPLAVCVDPGEPPFSHACVWQDGEHECPVGWDERHLLAESWSDTRSCSSCECGAVSAPCSGSLQVTGELDCATTSWFVSVQMGAGCQALPVGASAVGLRYTAAPTDATCPAGGGELEGTVGLIGVRTVCCVP